MDEEVRKCGEVQKAILLNASFLDSGRKEAGIGLTRKENRWLSPIPFGT
jgi:hypothetical protein